MRYLKLKGQEFLINGKSTLRVGHVLTMPSPVSKGRTVKVFEVLEHTRLNLANPIPRGSMIAVSFPDEHLHDAEFTWRANEECQVPYEIRDRKANLDALTKN